MQLVFCRRSDRNVRFARPAMQRGSAEVDFEGLEVTHNLKVRLAICFRRHCVTSFKMASGRWSEVVFIFSGQLASCSTLILFALMWDQSLRPLFDTGPSSIPWSDQQLGESRVVLVWKMLIKEYRIPLPMSVEEYRIAQLYMIQVIFFYVWSITLYL